MNAEKRASNHLRRRNTLRLPDYDYSSPGAYFVTAVVRGREPLFGAVVDGKMRLNALGEIVWEVWRALPQRYPQLELDEAIVMPDHFHGILWIVDKSTDLVSSVGAIHELPQPREREPSRQKRRRMLLSLVMGYFKMNTAKRINLLRGTPGVRVWQRGYYDRVIRNEEALTAIRRYIRYNPLRWEERRQNV